MDICIYIHIHIWIYIQNIKIKDIYTKYISTYIHISICWCFTASWAHTLLGSSSSPSCRGWNQWKRGRKAAGKPNARLASSLPLHGKWQHTNTSSCYLHTYSIASASSGKCHSSKLHKPAPLRYDLWLWNTGELGSTSPFLKSLQKVVALPEVLDSWCPCWIAVR